MKTKHRLRSFLSALFLILLILTVGLKLFFLDSRRVASGSMEKTLKHGDYILVWKLDFTHNKQDANMPEPVQLRRQDIVLLEIPGEREILIKRLIGLPGDTIVLSDAGITVNGRLLAEPYAVPPSAPASTVTYRIPTGTLFVLGDNRPVSRDSRVFGAVSIAAVKGKVLLCYYPFGRMRWLG